jgi:hypothetical protein
MIGELMTLIGNRAFPRQDDTRVTRGVPLTNRVTAEMALRTCWDSDAGRHAVGPICRLTAESRYDPHDLQRRYRRVSIRYVPARAGRR